MSPLRRKLQRDGHFLTFWLLGFAGRLLDPLGLERFHQRMVQRAIRRRQLFDRQYYLDRNDDLRELESRPLLHYVRYGDREGRQPMPLFDPLHYAQQAGIPPISKVNRLLHYACIGRYRGFSPSPWFDLTYYLSRNKDVARSGVDPLLHFVRWGGHEGRDPSPHFATVYYLSTVPEASEWGINPLIHYLEQGQYEGRSPMPSAEEGSYLLSPPGPVRPAAVEWDDLTAPQFSGPPLVDVIVPVYRGLEVSLRCISSVLRARRQTTPFELIVINDASPDDELVAQLEDLAGRGLFTLLSHRDNQGFVRSANEGLQLHPERDAVLLNSDTEVYGDWLDRLRACCYRGSRVGSVTPLSNNATLCSYPNFLHDNPYPLEIGYDELDRIAAEANAGHAVEAPTGVGFCLYLRRECIVETGLFDEDAFGRGYGEENDFCQRAIHRGWKNLIACDVFVRHWGAASFRGERVRRLKMALDVLQQRHPHYLRDVRRFIQADPLRRYRARLDLGRLERVRKEHNVLLITHSRGGGTERHVREDAERLRAAGLGVFLLRPAAKKGMVLLGHPDIDALSGLATLTLHQVETVDLLRHLAIDEIHIHHLIDFPDDAVDRLPQLARALRAPMRVMIHDYTSICPRVNLVDGSGIYCGEPEERVCNACIRRNGSEFGRVDIAVWRAGYRRLLESAESVAVPDADVAVRLGRHFRTIAFGVQPHEEPVPAAFRFRPPSLQPGERLRVVVIGAIGKIKGYEILLACAKDARKRDLPIDYTVYGYTMNDVLLRREGVTVTGRYLEQQSDEGLALLSPHCIWLPYAWPETYSYTLSIALRHGRPTFAFDLGAIASRLRALGADDYLMPLVLAHRVPSINDRFLTYRAAIEARTSEPSESADGGYAEVLGRGTVEAIQSLADQASRLVEDTRCEDASLDGEWAAPLPAVPGLRDGLIKRSGWLGESGDERRRD